MMNYSDEQLVIIKQMTELAENFADQILRIMENHGLDQVKGCRMKIDINPSMDLVTKMIDFGDGIYMPSGYIRLTKGKEETRYAPTGKNSAEYECLFAEPEVAKRISNILHNAKPLPPDGLWIGRTDDRPAVDCGV